jgi:signal peptide peptidase SppA
MSKDTSPRLLLPHIASRIFETPLLIEHSKLIAILNVLGPRLGFESPTVEVSGDAFAYSEPQRHIEMLARVEKVEQKKEGHYISDGVAIIPIIGTLVQRSDWMSAMSGMVGYGQIERMFMASLDDPEAREIVLEIDSPGGEVAGAFDFADRLYESRGKKPVTAVATEFAASAAYLIASAATEIALPRTGYVGSVGVVGTHVDYSKALEKRGIAVTFIYAGEKKVDGNPYQPLPDYVKAEWQDEIERVYRLFVETVARNRGMTQEEVRDTQAAMFMGHKAVEVGLATRVNTFTNEINRATLRARGVVMSMKSANKETCMKTEAEIRAEVEAKVKAEHEAKAKADAEAKAKADAEAKAKADADAKAKEHGEADKDKVGAAVKAERERGTAIRALPEAKGREQLAGTLVDQGLSVEAAKAILAAAPKASSLNDAMSGYSPRIGSEDAPEAGAPVVINSAGIYAARRAAAEKARAH